MDPLNQLFGKKVLVTGASGFIGSHLCHHLHNSSADVYAVSRAFRPNFTDRINWLQANLEDLSAIRNLINKVKPDVIYHLSSHVTGSRAMEHVLPTLQSNFVSTVNLLTAATEIGCQRIVLAGSLEEPEPSQFPVAPTSPYAAAKWASSTYARMFHELYATPVVTARIFMVYGPNQNARFLIPYVISSLLQDISPKLSSGKRPIDWIFVNDLVSGLLKMASVPNIEGSTVDLGSGTLVTVRDVVQKIVSILDSQVNPSFGAIADRVMEQVRVANPADSYARLQWKPQVSLEAGLKLTVEWYAEHLRVQQERDERLFTR